MERKEMLKKIGSYVLALSICGSSTLLSGCDKNQEDNNQKYGYYYVVLNDNNAVIYDNSIYDINVHGYSGNATVIDGNKQIYLTNYIRFKHCSKTEIEEQIKYLIGKDGNIYYYGCEEEKTLKKINK